MNTEWSTGYFVGINGKTTEYLVATADGVFSCATIRRLPDEEAYDPQCISIVKVTYREYVLGGASSTPAGVRFGETNTKNVETDPITAPMVPRRARLKPEDFVQFGYTVGCPGCDQLQIGGSLRRNHTDVCRDRIETALSTTEHGKDRLGRAQDRLDAKLAEIVEEMADAPGHPKDVSSEQQQPQGEMPAASTHMDEEESLEEVPISGSDMRISVRGTREIYIGTPERPRRQKRRGDPDDMEDDDFKTRRFNSETEEGESESMSPDNEPDAKLRKLDDEMLDSMAEIDRKSLAAAILGVDITEVDSPERVAKVAQRLGLKAGSSFDLTKGWDFKIEDHRKKAWTKIEEESL
jgi:hypothetical protein